MDNKENQLVYKDPNRMRKKGLLFFVLSPVFFLAFQKETFSSFGDWEFVVIRISAWLVVAISLLMIVLSADLTVIAEKSMRTLRLRYGTLLHRTREIPFDDIADIQAQKGVYTSSASRTGYRLVAVLKDGTVVPFRGYFAKDNYSLRGSPTVKVAADLRHFITGKRRSDVPQVESPGSSLSI